MTPTTDQCPWCRADIRPSTVITDEFGTVASYRCPGCRKAWTCDSGSDDPPPGPP